MAQIYFRINLVDIRASDQGEVCEGYEPPSVFFIAVCELYLTEKGSIHPSLFMAIPAIFAG